MLLSDGLKTLLYEVSPSINTTSIDLLHPVLLHIGHAVPYSGIESWQWTRTVTSNMDTIPRTTRLFGLCITPICIKAQNSKNVLLHALVIICMQACNWKN